MSWQPIDTAPTDGAWVLCYGTTDHELGEPESCKVFTAQFTNSLNGGTYEPGWWQFAWFDGGYYGRCKPTHWMPLPEAP